MKKTDVRLALVIVDDFDISDEERKAVHIRSTVSTALTLCGWCDVANKSSKAAKPTCKSCLKVVAFCKSLKGPGL